MTRRALALTVLALTACAAGCGGKKGTLKVTLVTPLGADPFAGAAKVHIRVANPPVVEQTVTLNGGHFTADLSFKPPSFTLVGDVLIEALAADGNVVARGRSPDISFVAADASLAVWVAPVGQVSVFPTALAKPRLGFAAAEMPGLGALLAGGHTADADGGAGTELTDCDLFEAFTLQVLSVQPLPSVRGGAVAIPVATSGQAVGTVLLAGGGRSSSLISFSAAGLIGTWTPLATDASLARDNASAVVLADGTTLFAGGEGSAGVSTSATIINSAGSVSVTPLAAMTVNPRVRHTATAAKVQGGQGALLVGGEGVPPEVYVAATRTFVGLAGVAVVPIGGHSATPLPSGEVLILGGIVSRMSQMITADAWIIDAVSGTATPPAAPLLSTPRAAHTATLVGTTLLVCGGIDASGHALASCDVIDVSAAPKLVKTIKLASPRTQHVAVVLPQGIVLLAGGQDDHAPLGSLEIYTP